MPRLTWVLLCYFGSQLGPFSMLVFYTLHEKLLYYVVFVNWSDYVVKLREHADSKRPMDDNSFLCVFIYKNILLILLLIIIIIIVIIIFIIIIIVVITTSILLSKSNCATKPFHLAKQTSA